MRILVVGGAVETDDEGGIGNGQEGGDEKKLCTGKRVGGQRMT